MRCIQQRSIITPVYTMGTYPGYQVVYTPNFVTPDGYDEVSSSLANYIPGNQPSGSYQYLEPVQQSNAYFYDSETGSRYPPATRYASSFNDASHSPPDLTDSPSVSSRSSIGTPSGRSYQSIPGSYFPRQPSRKNTGPHSIQEDEPRYPAVGDDGDGLDYVGMGRAFESMNLQEGYSGQLDSELYENSEYQAPRGKPRELAKDDREAAIMEEVHNMFDEAERTVTALDWTQEGIGPRPGIATNFKGNNVAFRAIRESESINKDLKGIAAKLADFRHRMRKHRPSFRKGSSSSKHPPPSERDLYYYGKTHKKDRDRDRDRDSHRHRK